MSKTIYLFTFGLGLQAGCFTKDTEETDTENDSSNQSDDSEDSEDSDSEDTDSGDTDIEDTSTPIDTGEEDTGEPTPTYDCGDSEVYDPVPIGNWRICRSKALELNQPTLATEALELLTSDLTHIETLLDPEIIADLQTVRIWLEEDIPAFPGGVYHPSETWLSNNGYPPYWAEGVQLGNAANYISWVNTQPAILLHEFSHAWHHQVLGYDHPEIEAAYDAAVASGIYENVEYANGGTYEAYALTNKQEYFAELTEAYFWENDYYPFNQAELEAFDLQGYQVIENAWVYPEQLDSV